VKFVGFIVVSLGTCCLAASLHGREVVSCPSPDGKFAMRCIYAGSQPYNGDTTIIDTATHKTVSVLDSNWSLGQAKLIWSPDSQRVAYFSGKGKDSGTRIFSRHNSSFEEITLPELPSPKLPANAVTESDADTSTRTEPMSWSSARHLLLDKELVNPNWGRAALRITLQFNQGNRPLVRSAKQERVSIIDYFLLLPPKDFEAPLSAWLRMMRGSDYFPCDAEPEHNVDEKNGYMYCRGDGAEPEFEVALFCYRDGRPLLALCSGELEGTDSVQLKFFELGSEGKMQQVSQPVLLGADMKNEPGTGYVKEAWQFELPRTGKMIRVRAQKDKKILHEFTWTGEKFEKEK
jgi:hypothetical protein